MLLLSRRKQESIRIGEDILVTVCGINGGEVKIGILAPDNVKILREELIMRDHYKRERKDENRTVEI
jgi:carbon storage regulator